MAISIRHDWDEVTIPHRAELEAVVGFLPRVFIYWVIADMPACSRFIGVVGMEFFKFALKSINVGGGKFICRRRREESHPFRLSGEF